MAKQKVTSNENVAKMMRRAYILLAFVFLLAQTSCVWVTDAFKDFYREIVIGETATVIASRAYIRSSYAVVAADILEVKRGDILDILDETVHEKVKWYRVRAHDEESTEGWIEAQNVIIGSLLEKSRKLAEEDKDREPQAKGQLRATAKLRFSPEISDDNVLLTLEKKGEIQTVFDIMGWKYVPKQDVSDNSNERQEEIETVKQDKKQETIDEKYDIWYKVRLSPAISPAPAGWIFGRQVELLVPQDIMYYQFQGKRFVAWHRIDSSDSDTYTVSKTSRPGSWVVLSRSNSVKADTADQEPDFDEILVFYYDKYSEEHVTVYRSGEVWGKLPLKVGGQGLNKTFTVPLRNMNGEFEEKTFTISRNARGHMQVIPPSDVPKFRAK